MAPRLLRSQNLTQKTVNYLAANARLKKIQVGHVTWKEVEPQYDRDGVMTQMRSSLDVQLQLTDELESKLSKTMEAMQMLESTVMQTKEAMNSNLISKLASLSQNTDEKLQASERKLMQYGTEESAKAAENTAKAVMALFGNSMVNINDKIDALHHKCAEVDKDVADVKVKVSTTSLECCKWDQYAQKLNFECFNELTVAKLEQLEMLHIAYEKENPLTVHANVIQQLRTELYDRLLPSREWIDERIDEFLDHRHELKKPLKKRRG